MQICYNNSIDELQETYHFFEEHLGVCQERIRQCLIELEKSGFIKFYKATISKYGIKCRNTPCIRLIKNFQPASGNIPHENEKNFASTPKNFGVKPKEILPQPQKSLDQYIYIDNNKDISNKSRSSESIIFQNEKNENEIDQNRQLSQHSPQQNLKQDFLSTTKQSANNHQESENVRKSEVNFITGPLQVNQALQTILDEVIRQDVIKYHQLITIQQ
nr:hypothetical protein [Rickettsia parkeri]